MLVGLENFFFFVFKFLARLSLAAFLPLLGILHLPMQPTFGARLTLRMLVERGACDVVARAIVLVSEVGNHLQKQLWVVAKKSKARLPPAIMLLVRVCQF